MLTILHNKKRTILCGILIISITLIVFYSPKIFRGPDPEMLFYRYMPGNHEGVPRTYLSQSPEILTKNVHDVNYYSEMQQMTLLAAACHVGNVNVVRILLERGANPNPNKGIPPVIEAAGSRSLEVLNALLAAGADPNKTDDNGRTAIHMALYKDNIEAVRMLLEHGANQSIKDSKGRTAMQYALEIDRPEIVFLLRSNEAHDDTE